MIALTDTEMHVVINALYCAADVYLDCARKSRALVDDGVCNAERTVAQFNQQAREARELAERIEEAS